MTVRNRGSTTATQAAETATAAAGATAGLTPEETKARESKGRKVAIRVGLSFAMIFLALGIVWLGHLWLSLLVVFIQIGLFRELVNVRYNPAKELKVPLFRTIQWLMFFAMMFYTYGKFLISSGLVIRLSTRLEAHLLVRPVLHYHGFITFSWYVCIFVTYVLSLRTGLYKYQIGNFVWTVAILCLTVMQVRGAVYLIFEGIFWFAIPCALVVANDSFAYISGMCCGKRFVRAPFLSLSPNKTWEGFIGAFLITPVFGWFFSDLFSRSTWLVCPQPELLLLGDPLDCKIDEVFVPQIIHFPNQEFSLFALYAKKCQIHAFIFGIFASIVAPFGGFLASAIKRAYNIKDFDSFIPGHGGVMDRMDCQFLMLLCAYVHYSTFIRPYDLNVDQILRVIRGMPEDDQHHVMHRLAGLLNATVTAT